MSATGATVLVTGSSGLLGRHVVHELRSRWPTIRLTLAARRIESAIAVPDPNAPRTFLLDLTGPISLPPGIDVIVHCAGEKRDDSRMEEVNSLGARNLALAAADAGVRRFVHVSSVGVYGASPNSGVVDETTPHGPRNAYEVTKEDGERAVREVCLSSGMECIVVQPATVIGSVAGISYPLLGLMLAIKRGHFLWFGAGDAWVNYVSAEDVAAAIVDAALVGRGGGTYIINTPERLRNVVTWIAQDLELETPHLHAPLWVGRVGAEIGSFIARLGGRAVPFDRARLLELTSTTRFDGSALGKATGFVYPVGVRNMLGRLVAAYRREGRL